MSARRLHWLVTALTGTAMTLAPWIGFLAPRPTTDLMLIALTVGVAIPLLMLRTPGQRVAGAALSLIGLFPAMLLSEVLAHLTFGGCLK